MWNEKINPPSQKRRGIVVNFQKRFNLQDILLNQNMCEDHYTILFCMIESVDRKQMQKKIPILHLTI